ncbi:hypothetical protein B0J12DRAFT_705711 [Macrophomina phaseolina]|uniref:Cytochrome P450 n=1 Tax=Macrophomina phaseolina TaxID=35725 RepID=A0ABQ8FR80_9PEZI|nr:hypothetical protein B0J12DRAFT_705711 [Macrophomina phaseolina]
MLTTNSTEEHRRLQRILSNSFSENALRLQEPVTKKNVYMLVNTNDRLAKKSDPAQDAVKLYNCAIFDIIADLVFSESLGLLGNAELSSGVETKARVQKRAESGIERPDIWNALLKKFGHKLTPTERSDNADILMFGGIKDDSYPYEVRNLFTPVGVGGEA